MRLQLNLRKVEELDADEGVENEVSSLGVSKIESFSVMHHSNRIILLPHLFVPVYLGDGSGRRVITGALLLYSR